LERGVDLDEKILFTENGKQQNLGVSSCFLTSFSFSSSPWRISNISE
jgi:hypothetical protein